MADAAQRLSLEECDRDGRYFAIRAIDMFADAAEYRAVLYLGDGDRWEVDSFEAVAPEGELITEEQVRCWWRDTHGVVALDAMNGDDAGDCAGCGGHGCSGCVAAHGCVF